VTLFLALEDEFNDTIPDEELEQFKTIKNIVDYIKGRMEAA
jgi:acyl carrier protein